MPPVDLDDRALFVERVLAATVTFAEYARGEYAPIASSARIRMVAEVRREAESVEVRMRSPDGRIRKTLTFFPAGGVRADFSWEVSAFPADAFFTSEVSLSRAHALYTSREAEVWEHPIETVAKSERGLDRTLQGTAYLVRWPVTVGEATVEIPAH